MAELQTDSARQQRLSPLIAAIEERERAERIRQGYLLEDGQEVNPGIAGPSSSSAEPRTRRIEGGTTYPVPTPTSQGVAPPRETEFVDVGASPDELRRLAEEDTKRRIRESGEDIGTSQDEGVKGAVGGGLAPRRRKRG
jgi:NADH dehydrogenase [ubiquinone] 1 alpha subcomplex assembly factor 2